VRLLVAALLTLSLPAAAAEFAEAPRPSLPGLPAAPAAGLGTGLGAGGGAGALLRATIEGALSARTGLPQIPGLPTAPQLRLAAPPAPAQPAAIPEGLPEAPQALPAALGPSALGTAPAALPAGALGPASGLARYRPTPLTGGEASVLAASAKPAGGLSALGRQAAQTLSEVRALPEAAAGEGASQLGRRLWEREPRRQDPPRTARVMDFSETHGGQPGAGPNGAAGSTAAGEASAAPAQAGERSSAPSPESFEAASVRAVGLLRPYSPDVVGRRVASPEAVSFPSASWAAAAAPPARPPVPLVALRVAGEALILTESLEPVPAGPAALAASAAALAALPRAAAAPAAAAWAEGRMADAVAAAGPAPVAAAAAAPAAAPADAFSVAESPAQPGPSFDAGDPGAARVQRAQRQEAPAPRAAAQLASTQPWIWLLPVALLAFRYRREYL
jgi:hypothetical protein